MGSPLLLSILINVKMQAIVLLSHTQTTALAIGSYKSKCIIVAVQQNCAYPVESVYLDLTLFFFCGGYFQKGRDSYVNNSI